MPLNLQTFDPSAEEKQRLEIEQLRTNVEQAPKLIDLRKQELLQRKIQRYGTMADTELGAKLWNADPDLVRLTGPITVRAQGDIETISVGDATILHDKRRGTMTQIRPLTRQQREGEAFSLLTPEQRRLSVLAPTERQLAGAEASRSAAEQSRSVAAVNRARLAGTLPAAPGTFKAPKVNVVGGMPASITDPNTGQSYQITDTNIPEELRPVAEGAKTAALANANKLTSSTKVMIEAAPEVQRLAENAFALIKGDPARGIPTLEHELGPIRGRWRSLVTGTGGVAHPAFIKLDTTVGLMLTLLMRMHVGARGGEYIMKHFERRFTAGYQSPENLAASLAVAIDYAKRIAAKRPKTFEDLLRTDREDLTQSDAFKKVLASAPKELRDETEHDIATQAPVSVPTTAFLNTSAASGSEMLGLRGTASQPETLGASPDVIDIRPLQSPQQ